MFSVRENFVRTYRPQWREKRDYIDEYDLAAFERVRDGGLSEIVRDINNLDKSDCHEMHAMFSRLASGINADPKNKDLVFQTGHIIVSASSWDTGRCAIKIWRSYTGDHSFYKRSDGQDI